jgi:hypothetical protein
MNLKKKSLLLIEVPVIFLSTLKKILSEEVQIPPLNVLILLPLLFVTESFMLILMG